MSASPNSIFRPLPRHRRGRSANAWSAEELRRLRELAKRGTPLQLMARLLRRTESAIKNKAGMHGISLQASGSRAHSDAAQSISPREEQEESVHDHRP